MKGISTYLTFSGNAEEAFNFYKSVFGGDFSFIQRFKNLPEEDGGGKLSAEEKEKIMHVSLPVGNSVLMGSDMLETQGIPLNVGNNFSIHIEAESRQEADALFAKLSDGGTVTMPIDKTFWNAYFGMVTDKFGISWMVDYQL